jgi:hypothetical protein
MMVAREVLEDAVWIASVNGGKRTGALAFVSFNLTYRDF